MLDERVPEALTFDDVLLVPQRSEVLPSEVDIRTRLTRNISLNVPVVSAAMDTVTEAPLAIAMAQEGGMGFVHKNMPIEAQASEVDKVKRSESGMIVDPVTVAPTARVAEALELMSKYRISGVPVTVGKKLVGILTNRDLRFETRTNLAVSELMTKDDLITVPVGTTLEQAKEILHRHKVEKLLVVDRDYNLKGLITVKDIQKQIKYPNACKDSLGRLRVGAAIGAMKEGSRDRYFQEFEGNTQKLVPEGIEGMVPYKGPLSAMVQQLVGGIRAGMGYCGTSSIRDLQTRGRFVRISSAGLKESHVHDVIITKEAPNYRLE